MAEAKYSSKVDDEASAGFSNFHKGPDDDGVSERLCVRVKNQTKEQEGG